MSSEDIKSNLEAIQQRIARACQKAGRSTNEVTLVAVTKTIEPASIETAFRLGIRHFGENRVQEAEKKRSTLCNLQPFPIWHMIGHLQSNKIKPALELFDIIQSVDTIKLAKAINKQASRKVQVLLEINAAEEPTKYGFSQNEIEAALITIKGFPNIEVKGLMTVAPLIEDPEKVRPIFRRLREIRDKLHLEHLSMGMTDDFEVAIEEGATIVRIGRGIFGDRK